MENLRTVDEIAALEKKAESTLLNKSGGDNFSTVSTSGSGTIYGLPLDDQIEIAQVRHELHDATKMQTSILDLAQDELKQIRAADKREHYIQSKIPVGLEDRIEHVQEMHEKHLKDAQLHMLNEEQLHRQKQELADVKRAEYLAKKVEAAKYTEGPRIV